MLKTIATTVGAGLSFIAAKNAFEETTKYLKAEDPKGEHTTPSLFVAGGVLIVGLAITNSIADFMFGDCDGRN
jgi:hypothetical protein